MVRTGKSTKRIPNGTFGTIVDLSKKSQVLKIKTDDGKIVTISNKKFRRKLFDAKGKCAGFELALPKVSLAYAITTHSCQGATFDRSFVIAGDSMQDQELTYVQGTRARKESKFYLTEAIAGEELTEMSRSKTISKTRNDLAERKFPKSRLERSLTTSRQKQFGLDRSRKIAEQNYLLQPQEKERERIHEK